MILHPHRPTRHIHCNATLIDGCGSLLDNDFLEHVCEAVTKAKAILITGPAGAKSELAAHLTRHHPEVASRIVGVETIDHPSDGALVAVARLSFDAKDSSLPQISQTDLWFLGLQERKSHVSWNNPPDHSHPDARRSIPVLAAQRQLGLFAIGRPRNDPDRGAHPRIAGPNIGAPTKVKRNTIAASPSGTPKEPKMRGFHEARASESRLRVVFEDDQVSFGFPTIATLGDVADCVAGLANFHDGVIVAIDVKMPRRTASSIASTRISHGTH